MKKNMPWVFSLTLILTQISSPNSVMASIGEFYMPKSQDEVLLIVNDSEDQNPRSTKYENRSVEGIIKIADSDLERAALSGDDRYTSYAEQALNTWISDKQTAFIPPDIYVMKARIAQRQHDFLKAESILQDVLSNHPNNGEAHLVLAYVLMAQGRADETDHHCRAVMSFKNDVMGLICESRSLLLQGRNTEAEKRLLFLSTRSDLPNDYLVELNLTLSEMAIWKGDEVKAEELLRHVMKIDDENIIAKIQLADLLLDQERNDDVRALLEKRDHPALRLRLWISGNADESSITKAERYRVLENNIGATRDDVLLLLQLGRPEQSLLAAKEMWKTQREPDDALIYLRAAKAVNSSRDINAVKEWQLSIGLKDTRISKALSGTNMAMMDHKNNEEAL